MTQKNNIISSLQKDMEKISSQKKKEWWEKYMRYVISFRGVGIPETNKRDALLPKYDFKC